MSLLFSQAQRRLDDVLLPAGTTLGARAGLRVRMSHSLDFLLQSGFQHDRFESLGKGLTSSGALLELGLRLRLE
jgi:hypothetical protein